MLDFSPASNKNPRENLLQKEVGKRTSGEESVVEKDQWDSVTGGFFFVVIMGNLESLYCSALPGCRQKTTV